MKSILLVMALAGTASSDPVPSTVSLDRAEIESLDLATSQTFTEPVGRRVDRDNPVITKLKLKAGDVIRTVNGDAVHSTFSLSFVGAIGYLDVIHDGKPGVVRVLVKPMTTAIAIDPDSYAFDNFGPAMKGGKPSGLVFLTPNGEFLAGDILRTIDGKAVTAPELVRDALVAAGKKGTAVPIVVDRFDTAITFQATVTVSQIAEEIQKGVKKVDETHYEIKKSLVSSILQNPMAVSKGARVVPSMKNGKADGFKLYAIRPSSFWAVIGFQNGDTLNSVNGFDLTSADKALEVYTKLREATNLEVAIQRRGKAITLHYTIK